jgi:Lar family restriction alleviation protein
MSVSDGEKPFKLSVPGNYELVIACPFCGKSSASVINSTSTNPTTAFYVHCGYCGARGPISCGKTWEDGILRAISMWNRPQHRDCHDGDATTCSDCWNEEETE